MFSFLLNSFFYLIKMSPKKTKQAEPTQTEETPKEINEVVEPKPKPKRKCSEKQLAALAEGRKKNPRLIAKQKREEEAKLNQSSTTKNQTPDQTAQQTI